MRRQTPFLLLVPCCLLLAQPTRPLDLCGQIDPPPGTATVTLEGVAGRHSARATVGSEGRFRFRKLPPGPYVVTVFSPGAGMTRRSIDVTPSLARAQGCVETTIPFSDSTITAERSRRFRSTVSLKELSIPDRARREFEEARAKLRKRDPAAAASHLKKAVEIAPQYMLAWNDLGMIAYRAGRWSDAETCFRKALEIRPTSVMVAVNLGGALYYAGKYKEAVEYNKLAVERSPNNALANFQLGMSYFMLEQDELSLKYLSQAKKLDPSNHSNPQLMLASIHARRGDAAAALGELQDFLERHPDSTLAPKVREELARFKR